MIIPDDLSVFGTHKKPKKEKSDSTKDETSAADETARDLEEMSDEE